MRARVLLWVSVGVVGAGVALATACVDNVTPDCSGVQGDCFPTSDSGPLSDGGGSDATDGQAGDASTDGPAEATVDGGTDASTDAPAE